MPVQRTTDRVFSDNLLAAQFWKDELGKACQGARFSPESATAGRGSSKRSFEFPRDVASRAIEVGNGSEQRIQVLLFAALAFLLRKHDAAGDIIINTPVYSSENPEVLENTVLILKFDPAVARTFKDLALQVRETIKQAINYQNYSCEALLYNLEIDHRSINNVACVYTNVQRPVYLERYEFDLVFSITREGSGLMMDITYRDLLYSDKYVQRIFNQVIAVLQFGLFHSERALAEATITAAADIDEITSAGRGREKNYGKSVLQWFHECVAKNPHAVAIKYSGKEYSYARLQSDSTCVAALIAERKKSDNEFAVAILCDRSYNMIVATLAVLKSGGYFVPVDPDLPAERIKIILKHSPHQMLIVDSRNRDHAGDDECIIIDQVNFQEAGSSINIFEANRLAYLLYTSGSTGTPRGCLLEHGNLTNYIGWANDYYFHDDVEGHWGLFSPISFDFTLTSIFCCLTRGKTLSIFEQRDDVTKVLKEIFLGDNPIDIVKLTPSHVLLMDDWSQQSSKISKVILGGEAVNEVHLEILKRVVPGCSIYNEYGPTEATVGCIAAEVFFGKRITIGVPIDNTSIWIVDDNLNRLPHGMNGQICISGNSVFRGYLNEPEIQGTKLVYPSWLHGQKAYMTGDQGKLIDGEFMYLGRRDGQVKIRGNRVELREVDAAIRNLPSVRDVVVTTFDASQGQLMLVAYVIENVHLLTSAYQEALRKSYPDFMIPSYFTSLDKFPVTPNGKVDEKALPRPSFHDSIDESNPTDHIEAVLVSIWKEVFRKDRIGLREGFFQLGGHSLRAFQVLSRIQSELNVSVELKTLFDNPTIESLASVIRGSSIVTDDEIRPAEHNELYEASYAQKRIYFAQEIESSSGYNMSSFLRITGDLDLEALDSAIGQLVLRHEILRTVFINNEKGLFQKVLTPGSYSNSIVYRDKPIEAATIQAEAESIVSQTFSLEKGPLFNVTVFHTNDREFYVLLVMHHIIADGWSMQILLKDFLAYYDSILSGTPADLPELKIQYKDFSLWHNNHQATFDHTASKNFWIEKLSGEIPRLNLPLKKPRGIYRSTLGRTVDFEIPAELFTAIKSYCKQNEISHFVYLAAVFKVVLSRFTGDTDIIIGTTTAGRYRKELENQIGYYINTIPIRSTVDPDTTFDKFLSTIKSNVFDAFKHERYPFEQAMSARRDAERSTVFDVLFEVLHFDDLLSPTHSFNGLRAAPGRIENNATIFDLCLFVTEERNGMTLSIQYNTDILEDVLIRELSDSFLLLASSFTKPGNKTIGDFVFTSARSIQSQSEFTGPVVELPELSVVEIFQKRTKESPTQPAIVDSQGAFSFEELEKYANGLVGLLESIGVRKELVLPCLVDRSRYTLGAMLGIFKCGAVYLPLASEDPIDRLKVIIEDSSAEVLLFSKAFLSIARTLQWRCKSLKTIICIDGMDVHKIVEPMLPSMDRSYWEFVGSRATNSIEGGGWISSYTGRHFSREEMEDFAGNAATKLAKYLHKDTRVLEIGCATGITMLAIAPIIGSYRGIDISQRAIEFINSTASEAGLLNVAAERLEAADIDKINDSFDVIILNSVVQYFTPNYLIDVITKASSLLTDKGVIFIGDVMDADKYDDFIADLLNYNKDAAETDKVTTDFPFHQFYPRLFFEDISHLIPAIREVSISKKFSKMDNELSRFRYDVVLGRDKNSASRPASNLHRRQLDQSSFAQKYESSQSERLSISDLAYVIYTSGSTGTPKGAMVEHRGMLNHLYAKISDLDIDRNSVIVQNAPVHFDIAIWQFLAGPIAGGRTVVIDDDAIQHTDECIETLNKHSVTHLEVVPSYLSYLCNTIRDTIGHVDLPSLRYLVATGEALPPALIELSRKVLPAIPLVNAYGPTEASDDITHYFVDADKKYYQVPVGRAIQNTRILIVKDGKQCPVGVKGEIWVTGAGVGRGYLNQPVKTRSSFVDFESLDGTKTKAYRTGDLGAYNPDGTVAFFGRIDTQVKLHGLRIELAEVEYWLGQVASIREAVVIMAESRKDYLIAFVTSKLDNKPDVQTIKTQLLKTLPHYMVPTEIVVIDQMPLNRNGKIDRRALEAMIYNEAAPAVEYVAPTTQLEQQMVATWESVLQKKVGINDNFFELGGHSLLAMEVINKLRNALSIQLQLKVLFDLPTVKQLAEYVEAYVWIKQSPEGAEHTDEELIL